MIAYVKSMTNFSGKERGHYEEEVTKSVAKGMKAALDVVLRTEANTASCLIMYQPKAPKELMNYRRNK